MTYKRIHKLISRPPVSSTGQASSRLLNFEGKASHIPPHLRNSTWPAFATTVVGHLLPEVDKAINKLKKRMSEKQVHSARIIMRRWRAVAQAIEADGWLFRQSKPLTKKLGKLGKTLGKVRDWEILIALAKTMGLPKSIRADWRQKRKACLAKVKEHLSGKKLFKLGKQFSGVIEQAQQAPRRYGEIGPVATLSAYNYLEPILQTLEDQTRKLEATASSPSELHQLRLKIKHWRYFLTEFYGLTNLQLVTAQQLLGKIHDLDHLVAVLNESKQSTYLDNAQIRHIAAVRRKLVKEFSHVRKHLPYGLRPYVISFPSGSFAG